MYSEQINELAKALAKAQGEIKGAKKSSDNPFFKSKYADLSEVWEACRDALSKNDVAVTQIPTVTSEGVFVLETMLLHSSGQWIRGVYPITPTKNDPQGVGSAITYARRYALAAMVGVAQEDDDGNAASNKAGGSAIDDSAAKLKAAIAKHKATIDAIVEGIASGNLSKAAEAWYELSNDEKASLWIAPTKCRQLGIDPPFSTQDRTVMQSTEFRESFYGKPESVNE